MALADFTSSREAVLAGDRTQGGSPSAELMTLAETAVIDEALIDIFNPAIASLNSETTVKHSEEDPSFSLEELLSGKKANTSIEAGDNNPVFLFETDIEEVTPTVNELESATNIISGTEATEELVSLPKLNLASSTPRNAIAVSQTTEPSSIELIPKQEFQICKQPQEQLSNSTSNISVRVDLGRLDRMNNLLGELTINCNMFALENEQIHQAIE
ncbi:MAG: hypothetical protein N2235_17645 [Fischerella sp.]|nr:hypothetical protein [Fischerella sp.]